MIYLQAIILGLIQALTEFLPISSSAHLILARAWMDFPLADGLTFDIALHVGTLIAIVIYFRQDIARLFRGFFRSIAHWNVRNDFEQRLAWYVFVGCIPAALVGGFFETAIEEYFRHPSVIVVTLVLGGILFLAVERYTIHTQPLEKLGLWSAFVIGVAQTLALVPGVSRSGITIAIGMSKHLKRAEAARFSFVMSAPLLFGAGLKRALDLVGYQLQPGELSVLAVGLVTSALGGWVVVRFLLNFLRNHTLKGFAYYRFALAAVVLVYVIATWQS